MSLLSPTWLLLLLPVAGLVAAYVVLQRRRRHHAVRFTNLDLLESVAPSRPGWRRHLVAGAAGLGVIALVVALANPVRDHQVPKDTATIVLAVDVSASMSAVDVDPSRLEAARTAAAAFVESLPDTFEVGLVAFDGSARLLAEPTTDHDTVVAALSELHAGEGTAAGDGLEVAVATVEAALAEDERVAATTDESADDDVVNGAVVLLSDGESTMGRPLEQATETAVAAGVPVSTIAYGTDTGTVVVQGERVQVPADVESMQQVADATGGQAFTAASAAELGAVLDDIETRIGTETEQQDLDHAFVAAAVVALMAAVGASMVWNGRFL